MYFIQIYCNIFRIQNDDYTIIDLYSRTQNNIPAHNALWLEII